MTTRGQERLGHSAPGQAAAASWVDVWDPGWYLALHLGERRALLDADPGAAGAPDSLADEILEEWATGQAFRDRDDFGERLAVEGLSEERLHVLLGQPADVWRDTWRDLRGEPPSWLSALAEAFTPPHVEAANGLGLADDEASGHTRLVALAGPIVARGRQRLGACLDSLRGRAAEVGLDLAGVEDLCLGGVLHDVLACSQRSLVLELHVFRLEGRLAGDDAAERYLDFARQLADPDVAVPLLREYCVLARRLVTLVDDWVSATAEMCERLVADWPLLREALGLGAGPQRLQQVRAGAGDKHRGGRTVHILTLSSGERVVYKPRGMAVDCHFQEIVAWLDGRLDRIDLQSAVVIDRGDYGWMEFLRHGPAESTAALARFYERLGAHLALLYALHATDMHSENLLAAGEHPHVVDVEALLHPRVHRVRLREEGNPARDALERSVYEVGLLPRRMWVRADGDAEGLDLSGVGGRGGQYSPDELPSLVDGGTDQMRVVRRRVPMPATENIPLRREGAPEFSPEEFAEDVIAGFEAAYEALRASKDELLAPDGPLEAFRDDWLRQIVRPTRTYALRLLEGSHPDYQRDALELDQFMDGLWAGRDRDGLLPKIFACERADLLSGDVPFFGAQPGSVDLSHGSGAVIGGYADRPGIEVAREKVAGLGAADLERQVWFIRASFTALEIGEETGSLPSFNLRLSQAEATSAELVEAACAVGDRLGELALSDDEVSSWLGLELVGERVWSLQPASPGLFSGLPGIVLFLARLGAVSGRAEYGALARRGLGALLRTWEHTRDYLEEAAPASHRFTVGAFDQLSGSVYALTHLGALWRQLRLVEEAARLAALLPRAIARDEEYDVISGSAGCVAVLRSLMAVSPSPDWLSAAVACGDRLEEAAEGAGRGLGWSSSFASRPLTGFSHGAAGNAWALVELAALCRGQTGYAHHAERFEHLAAQALVFERETFSERDRNWPDLRGVGDADGVEPNYMVAWCHGAPGVGLSRVLMSDHLDDPLLASEIDVALETTLRAGMGLSHALCHGSLGNLELPLAIIARHDDEALRRKVYRLAAGVLDSIAERGWLTGVPRGVETPGLMTGLAGIGHGLLRLWDPKLVPSVLTLDTPSALRSPR